MFILLSMKSANGKCMVYRNVFLVVRSACPQIAGHKGLFWIQFFEFLMSERAYGIQPDLDSL